MAAYPHIFDVLRKYIGREDFCGYDPYDALMGWSDFRFLGNNIPAALVQLQKRNPFNLRPMLGIPKMRNAKAVGLFLQAYCEMNPRPRILIQDDEGPHAPKQSDASTANNQLLTAKNRKQVHSEDVIHELFDWLYTNRSSWGRGWGYPFHWANPEKFLPANTPSAVVTGFVCRGIHAYYQHTLDPRALELLRSAADFVIEDLPRTETPEGLCFSYTAVKRDCCYNASLLAAEVLGRLYSVSGDTALRDLAVRVVDFVIAYQQEDGRWNYSLDPDNGHERAQIDFHQGYVLESIFELMQLLQLEGAVYQEALEKGARFYRHAQFFDNGRSKWRLPKEWPVDIHNQSQGIITFSRLRHLDESYLAFARTIAEWAIANMWDERGYFYYQKHRFYMNRIPYMRWSQAWMFLALITLENASMENV